MKEDICNYDLLLIRACKRNHDHKKMMSMIKRVIMRRNALPYRAVNDGIVIHCLLNIVLQYGLIRRMEEFITVNLNPKKWWGHEVLSYEENLIKELISKIGCVECAVFPRYPRPAYFRNKYKTKVT